MDSTSSTLVDGLTSNVATAEREGLLDGPSSRISRSGTTDGGKGLLRSACICAPASRENQSNETCQYCKEKQPETQELNVSKLRNSLAEKSPLFGDSYDDIDEMPVYRSVAVYEPSSQFLPSKKDSFYPEKLDTRFSFTSRPVNTLFWKFSKYPVALKHGFSSCGLSLLYTRIEETMFDLEIDFKFDGAALLYICEKTENCVCNSFTVIVSKLQKSCQDEIGYQYVIELCLLDGASCPTVWDKLTNSFFEKTKDVITCPSKKTHDKEVKLNDGFSENVDDKKAEGNEVLSSFIDLVYPASLSDNTVRMAEVFAELTSPDKASYREKWLRPKDIKKLMSMIDKGDRNLSRCVCTVIRNIAQAGLLQFISEENLESLLKALVRLLTLVDTSDVFLLELQREAMRALVAISELYQPSGFIKAMAATVVKRCATSSDDRLSGYAGQALNLYVQ